MVILHVGNLLSDLYFGQWLLYYIDLYYITVFILFIYFLLKSHL